MKVDKSPKITRIRAQPWPQIEAFYQSLVTERGLVLGDMVTLVRHLSTGPLFGCVDALSLVLATKSPITPGQNTLSVVIQHGSVKFEHTPAPGDPGFIRTYPSALAAARVDGVIRWIGW